MSTASVEVWKNTAAGMRWMSKLNAMGAEIGHTVQGNKTFSITTWERKLNQDKAANAGADLFRNGTFVLVKGGTETDDKEFSTPDALTDSELENRVNEVMAKNMTIEEVMHPITSPITMGRLREAMILENAGAADLEKVEAQLKELEGGPPVRRAASAAGGDSNRRVPDTSNVDGELKGDDVASPGRELVPERNK